MEMWNFGFEYYSGRVMSVINVAKKLGKN